MLSTPWRPALAALLTACSAAVPTSTEVIDVPATPEQLDDGSVAFAYSPERVGDVCDEWLEQETELTGAGSTVVDTLKWHVQYEVLEVLAGVSVNERVTYDTYEVTKSGVALPAPGPVGKTFVVKFESGRRAILDASGSPADPYDTEWFLDRWRVGKRERFGDELDGERFRPGDRVPRLTRAHIDRSDETLTKQYTFIGRRDGLAAIRFEIDGYVRDFDRRTTRSVRGTLFLSIPRGTLVREEHERLFEFVAADGTPALGNQTTRYRRERSRPGDDPAATSASDR